VNRRPHRRAALSRLGTWLALSIVAVAGSLMIASPGQAAAACSVGYRVGFRWPGGYQGTLTLTNTGDQNTQTWQIALTFRTGTQRVSYTNALVVVDSPTAPTIGNAAWNAVLRPGASQPITLVATGPGSGPTSMTCTVT
jgi:hypothetical protein